MRFLVSLVGVLFAADNCLASCADHFGILAHRSPIALSDLPIPEATYFGRSSGVEGWRTASEKATDRGKFYLRDGNWDAVFQIEGGSVEARRFWRLPREADRVLSNWRTGAAMIEYESPTTIHSAVRVGKYFFLATEVGVFRVRASNRTLLGVVGRAAREAVNGGKPELWHFVWGAYPEPGRTAGDVQPTAHTHYSPYLLSARSFNVVPFGKRGAPIEVSYDTTPPNERGSDPMKYDIGRIRSTEMSVRFAESTSYLQNELKVPMEQSF